MGVFAADIETTGLLQQMMKQEEPRLHCLGLIEASTGKEHVFEGSQRTAIQKFLDKGHTLIMHNGVLFDGEALKLLRYDISNIRIIDTLALSWYLEPQRMRHGLGEYGEEFGIPKPVIDDWENQTQDEYNHRVIEDCKIQLKLWHKLCKKLDELYGEGQHDRIINFLMWKMEELRQQQENKWKLDVPAAEALQQELELAIFDKVEILKLVMPKVPVMAVRKKPAKPFLKSTGELSATGIKWKALTEERGLPFDHPEDLKVITGWDIGNPASHTQMKAWLDSLGWEPETFKFVKDDNGGRNIPQINLKGGEICNSVKALIPKCADIEHIAGLGILNHRHSVVKGFLRDAIDGELIADCGGFTNTLRLQHREIVNLPSLRVKYGKELRGLLLARDGHKLLGSDLSSLEDRLKHHFQWPLDPGYVKSQMTEGFDPHNAIAVTAGLMTEDEKDFYAWYKGQH